MSMFDPKVVKKPTRRVWRMSETNLAGEFVLPCERQSKSPDPWEIHERGVRASSLDLAAGSEVIETDMDTLPGELVDELLKASR
jgi:hypothetical protein